MMSKKLQLHIQEQCHENWEDMTPVDKGRFCASCQKQVIDFTRMSDRQVAEFFKKPTTGSVCGRFMMDQLDRDIELQKKRLPWVKYFFQFALPAFLITKQAQAQGGVSYKLKTGAQKVICDVGVSKSGQVNAGNNWPITIKARIVDSALGQPVPYATIHVAEIGKNAIADCFGASDITIHEVLKEMTVTVTSAGYKPVTINQSLSPDIITNGFTIHMTSDIRDLPEVVVVGYGGIQVKGRYVTGTTTTIIPDTISKWLTKLTSSPRSEANCFKGIYPNPVKAGSSIKIELGKTAEGVWLLELLNASGQFMNKKEFWMDEQSRIIEMEIPAVSSGVYFLRATNKLSGKKFTEKIIVQ